MKKFDFVKQVEFFSKNNNFKFIKKIIGFEEITSTNKYAKKLAEKKDSDGTLIISKIQKEGRGRLNRSWFSPDGGLYFSIILKPNCPVDKTTLIPLVASLGVYDTISKICDLDVSIKWPNDVRINDKKVCGILLSSSASKDKVNYVIIGLGFNLNVDLEEIKKYDATSLSYEFGIKIDYFDFLLKLLHSFEKYYNVFLSQDYDILLDHWRRHSDTIGRKVIFEPENEEKCEGIAVDVDDCGFLMVETKDGNIKKIMSGDCFYIDKK